MLFIRRVRGSIDLFLAIEPHLPNAVREQAVGAVGSFDVQRGCGQLGELHHFLSIGT